MYYIGIEMQESDKYLIIYDHEDDSLEKEYCDLHRFLGLKKKEYREAVKKYDGKIKYEEYLPDFNEDDEHDIGYKRGECAEFLDCEKAIKFLNGYVKSVLVMKKLLNEEEGIRIDCSIR